MIKGEKKHGIIGRDTKRTHTHTNLRIYFKYFVLETLLHNTSAMAYQIQQTTAFIHIQNTSITLEMAQKPEFVF